MHNFSPTSPVLGDHLQLLPAQHRLRDVYLKVTAPGVFWSPPFYIYIYLYNDVCVCITLMCSNIKQDCLIFGFIPCDVVHPINSAHSNIIQAGINSITLKDFIVHSL